MLEFSAEVTDIRLESRGGGKNRWQLALDRTAFYPESGGQPWDLGIIEAVAPSGARLTVPVLEVVEDAGEIWHIVEKPLTAGTPVTGTVDPARRRDHMQQHTGQHLLSALFLRHLGAPTVSFHLGAHSSTIDLATSVRDRDRLLQVELQANEMIAENLSISVTTVSREEAEAMFARGDLHKLPDRAGPIRVVEIAGVEWNACGGTHLSSTAGIGAIALRGVERMKAGMRVEFCCGLRAVRSARIDFDRLGEVSRLLSTGPGELPAKVRAMLEEARTSTKERRALLDEMAYLQAQKLASPGTLAVAPARNVEYAKLLAAKIAQLGAIALVTTLEGEQATAVLAGDGLDCNTTMKAALLLCEGRGGGSQGMAQGTVPAGNLTHLVAEIRARAG